MFDELLKYIQLQIGMMDLSFSGTNLIEIAIIAVVLLVIVLAINFLTKVLAGKLDVNKQK